MVKLYAIGLEKAVYVMLIEFVFPIHFISTYFIAYLLFVIHVILVIYITQKTARIFIHLPNSSPSIGNLSIQYAWYGKSSKRSQIIIVPKNVGISLFDLLTVTVQGQIFFWRSLTTKDPFPSDKRVLGGHELSKKV